MKKKLVCLIAALLAVNVAAGCGTEKAQTALKDMKVDKYVTLGEYKQLAVTVAPVSVDEEQANILANEAYMSAVSMENGGITDRAVENGDTVIIDYEGKRDGVAFAGGTAQGASLAIGSGQFIDGFEEGLIGVMPGETVDLNLTFPEEYKNNPDLAGAEVVFTVTVHYIQPTEMTDDAVVAALGIDGVDTVDGLIQYAKDYLYEQETSSYDNRVRMAVLDAFMENCVFEKLPDNMVKEYQQLLRENIVLEAQAYSNYSGYSIDAETYAQQAYGYESLDAFVEDYSQEYVRQNLAMQAVANLENLNLDDEELETRLQKYAIESGYGTVEEFIGDTPKEDFREYFMNTDVMDFLVDNAVITESAE